MAGVILSEEELAAADAQRVKIRAKTAARKAKRKLAKQKAPQGVRKAVVVAPTTPNGSLVGRLKKRKKMLSGI